MPQDNTVSYYGVDITVGDTPTIPELENLAVLRSYLMRLWAIGEDFVPVVVTPRQLALLQADADVAAVAAARREAIQDEIALLRADLAVATLRADLVAAEIRARRAAEAE